LNAEKANDLLTFSPASPTSPKGPMKPLRPFCTQ